MATDSAEGVIAALRSFSRMSLAEIDAYPDTIYALDAADRLAYVNAAWGRFAADNGGEPAISRKWSIGAEIFSAIPAQLTGFYQDLYDHARTVDQDIVRHEYECSSAEVYRSYMMSVYPLKSVNGLLTVHARSMVRAHDVRERPPHSPDAAVYTHADGQIHQCIYCRRTEHPGQPDRWDWVPDWVREQPPNTSHGLCRLCVDCYFRKVGIVP